MSQTKESLPRFEVQNGTLQSTEEIGAQTPECFGFWSSRGWLCWKEFLPAFQKLAFSLESKGRERFAELTH